MQKNKIRLLIAEDHTIVRQGLIDILSRYEDISIIGEAENGFILVEKFTSLNPDIVLCDIEMPGKNGIDATSEILKSYPEAKIVFLSMYKSDEYLYKIFKLGAVGLIPKEVMKNDLVEAIRFVNNGGKYFLGFSEEEISKIVKRIEGKESTNPMYLSSELTQRELEVLLILGQGKTSEEIAEILGSISKRSIDAYRSSMMKKLNFTKAAELIRFAVQYTSSNEER